MKTRMLIAQHIESGKKIIDGTDENHPVFETSEDIIDALRDGTLTVGDCNSGFSVRRQRELRGELSIEDKRAKALGFDSADQMELEMGTRNALDVVEMARQAKLEKAAKLEETESEVLNEN